jgi:uncharacterized membrane protein
MLGCDTPSPTDPDSVSAVPGFGKATPAPVAGIEVLPALNGLWAQPADITNEGVIVGRSAFAESPALRFHAVRWTRATGSAAWQVEDLSGRLPSPEESQANKVNEDGLIIGSMETGGVLRGFVLPQSGPAIDLGPSVFANDLSAGGEMAGESTSASGGSGLITPLYWSAPGAAAETLPPLQPEQPARALFFTPAGDIVGTGSDSAGEWLVRWTRTASGWFIERLQPHVARAPLPRTMNTAGRAIGNGCPSPASCDPLYDTRPFVWTALTEPALALPTLTNRASSYVLGIADTGLMTGFGNLRGSTTARPVAWPSPASILELPLLPKGSSGMAGGVNNLGQIVGTVTVSEKSSSRVSAVVWTLP